jgi:hypothetical protein
MRMRAELNLESNQLFVSIVLVALLRALPISTFGQAKRAVRTIHEITRNGTKS